MKYRPIDPEVVSNIDNPIKTIMQNRGIVNYKDFLKDDENSICDYSLLSNIHKATDAFITFVNNDNTNIYIQVDPDVDGYTSAAMLYNYTKELFPKVNIEWNVYEGRKRGVVADDVPDYINLVVIPDAGTNQHEEHQKLWERNINTIIIDHHEGTESQYAITVNNKLSMLYPNQELSGAGVVYKFLKALDDKLNVKKADNYLDLVALGMIADMMDLRSKETKYYIKKGLKQIKNPFFKRMVDEQSYSLGNKITPIGIAFYIAPLINAMTRVGTIEEKQILFRAFIEEDHEVPSSKKGDKEGDTEMLTAQASRMCKNARDRQNRLIEPAKEEIEKIIAEEGLDQNAIITVDVTDLLDREFVGLCANQIANKYKRPCLLFKQGEEGEYTGSGRDCSNSGIDSLRDFLKGTEFFNFVEGHSGAFGASLPQEDVDAFIKYSNEQIGETVFEEVYDVDFIVEGKDMTKSLISNIAKLDFIWGQGIPEPLIAVTNIVYNKGNFSLMGKKKDTIKIRYNEIDYIKFRMKQDDIDKINPGTGYKEIEIVGRAKLNFWNGTTTYQILITDFEIKGEWEEEWSF